MKRLTAILASTAVFGIFGLAGPAAAATTITASVGPADVPGVPVSVCVNQSDPAVSECVTTPPAQTVSATVSVTFDVAPVVVLPSVTPISCPAGTGGVALSVFGGSVSAAISGSVTVTVNGTPTTVPISEVVAPPGQTVTVYACAGVSPGV